MKLWLQSLNTRSTLFIKRFLLLLHIFDLFIFFVDLILYHVDFGFPGSEFFWLLFQLLFDSFVLYLAFIELFKSPEILYTALTNLGVCRFLSGILNQSLE